MRLFKITILVLFLVVSLMTATTPKKVEGQSASEAPAGFDNRTNGLVAQEVFDEDLDVFVEQEFIADGLGPVYNAQSCGECHQNPVAGGISQITELRAGRTSGGFFSDHPGGSLINDRAINAAIQETVIPGNDVRTQRTSLNLLGDGFVESISDFTLIALAASQPLLSGGRVFGEVIFVPVLEANNFPRVGRFGWKNQHASLISFSADAYLNEMGITSPLQATENTSNGRSVAAFDAVPDPEDDGDDIEIFAEFMRATKVPPRDTALAATGDAQAGSNLFNAIGCAICHTRNITTAPAGTRINGGAFTVPPALGNKIIHPFGDFLLHDIGTGDGIVQNGGFTTRNKVRTAPLWGVRTRTRLLHDGSAETFADAIQSHNGEATFTKNNFNLLTTTQKNQVVTFLKSL